MLVLLLRDFEPTWRTSSITTWATRMIVSRWPRMRLGYWQVIGMMAIMCKQNVKEKYREQFRMIISLQWRRMGLGYKITQPLIDFCRKQGFFMVILETRSAQMAAMILSKELYFKQFLQTQRNSCSLSNFSSAACSCSRCFSPAVIVWTHVTPFHFFFFFWWWLYQFLEIHQFFLFDACFHHHRWFFNTIVIAD